MMTGKRYQIWRVILVAAVIGASSVCVSAYAAEGDQCLGWGSFLRVGTELPFDKLSKTQALHIKLLQESALSRHSKIAANPNIFSWFKYLDDFSVVADGTCDDRCTGSLLIFRGDKATLEDVTLASHGGMPYDVAYQDKAGKYVSTESEELHHSITLTFTLASPDGKSAFLMHKHVLASFLGSLTQQKYGTRRYPLDESKMSEADMFRKGKFTVEKKGIEYPGLPRIFGKECGGFVRDGDADEIRAIDISGGKHE